MANNTIFYTYLYLREDGTPYYVGKGTRHRVFSGIHRCGIPPLDRILLEPHTTEFEALAAEKFLISYYGREDLGLGCLLNLTDGGDGAGVNPSMETRRKMRQAKIGKPSWNKGKPWNEEHRNRIKKLRLGSHPSEETKRKTSESMKKYRQTPEGLASASKAGKLGGIARWKKEIKKEHPSGE